MGPPTVCGGRLDDVLCTCTSAAALSGGEDGDEAESESDDDGAANHESAAKLSWENFFDDSDLTAQEVESDPLGEDARKKRRETAEGKLQWVLRTQELARNIDAIDEGVHPDRSVLVVQILPLPRADSSSPLKLCSQQDVPRPC